jgi:hypothetical protein
MRNLTSLREEDWIICPSLRLFWKIVVEGNGDSLRAVKELSLWADAYRNSVGPHHTRLLWKQIPLQVEIGPPQVGGRHRDQTRISVEDGYIFFKGGYLKIYDTSLVEDVRSWGLELDPENAEAAAVTGLEPGSSAVKAYTDYARQVDGVPDLKDEVDPKQQDIYKRPEKEYVSDSVRPESDGPAYYAGYNVRLEVEFAAERSNDEKRYPLFYYPQDPANSKIGQIVLEVEKKADEHSLHWQISGDPAVSPLPYHLEEIHTVTVNQETEDPFEPLFEFLVDAIPLGKKGNQNRDTHLFSKTGRFFYIGFIPDAEKEDAEPFRGYIKRLMFDPNASCGSC